MKSFAIAAIAGLLSTSSFAYQIDTENCAGTAYIQDLDGKQVKYDPAIHDFVTEATEVTYKAWRQVPYLHAAAKATSNVMVENKSNSDVRFYFSARYYNSVGSKIDISYEEPLRKFSTVNDPRSSTGASLPAKTIGSIALRVHSTTYVGSATMRWESNECIQYPPLLTTVHRYWGETSGYRRGGISSYLINNGNPW